MRMDGRELGDLNAQDVLGIIDRGLNVRRQKSISPTIRDLPGGDKPRMNLFVKDGTGGYAFKMMMVALSCAILDAVDKHIPVHAILLGFEVEHVAVSPAKVEGVGGHRGE